MFAASPAAPGSRRGGDVCYSAALSAMFIRNFSSSCFLRNVFGTQPFIDYCQGRGIDLAQALTAPLEKQDLERWVTALARLRPEEQAEVELELASISDLADHGAVAQLFKGIEGKDLPSDSIPGDTALALWFFLRHQGVF